MADAEVSQQPVHRGLERLTGLSIQHCCLVAFAQALQVDIGPHELRVDCCQDLVEDCLSLRRL